LQVKTALDSAGVYAVSMEITDVTLEDAGKYKVIAKNEHGECSASISLNFDSELLLMTMTMMMMMMMMMMIAQVMKPHPLRAREPNPTSPRDL
jgi:hypothetical protein